jgi:hypothetical protein
MAGILLKSSLDYYYGPRGVFEVPLLTREE